MLPQYDRVQLARLLEQHSSRYPDGPVLQRRTGDIARNSLVKYRLFSVGELVAVLRIGMGYGESFYIDYIGQITAKCSGTYTIQVWATREEKKDQAKTREEHGNFLWLIDYPEVRTYCHESLGIAKQDEKEAEEEPPTQCKKRKGRRYQKAYNKAARVMDQLEDLSESIQALRRTLDLFGEYPADDDMSEAEGDLEETMGEVTYQMDQNGHNPFDEECSHDEKDDSDE